MGIVEGDHDAEEVLRALQQNLREHMVLIVVILLLVCAAVVLFAVYFANRKKRAAGEKKVGAVVQNAETAEKAGEITLDLTEQTEELRAYADEVHTLVDIGYFSETEVIE